MKEDFVGKIIKNILSFGDVSENILSFGDDSEDESEDEGFKDPSE